MMKVLVVLSCIFLLSAYSDVEAKSSKSKKKPRHARTKKQKRRHHGNGPDLKAITKESSFTEIPNNGVTPLETNGSAQ